MSDSRGIFFQSSTLFCLFLHDATELKPNASFKVVLQSFQMLLKSCLAYEFLLFESQYSLLKSMQCISNFFLVSLNSRLNLR